MRRVIILANFGTGCDMLHRISGALLACTCSVAVVPDTDGGSVYEAASFGALLADEAIELCSLKHAKKLISVAESAERISFLVKNANRKSKYDKRQDRYRARYHGKGKR